MYLTVTSNPTTTPVVIPYWLLRSFINCLIAPIPESARAITNHPPIMNPPCCSKVKAEMMAVGIESKKRKNPCALFIFNHPEKYNAKLNIYFVYTLPT
ncbi:Uncharacterised protein [Vibrio cholerae]|nr:Uncharacterised protein [Vibrio cholerae]